MSAVEILEGPLECWPVCSKPGIETIVNPFRAWKSTKTHARLHVRAIAATTAITTTTALRVAYLSSFSTSINLSSSLPSNNLSTIQLRYSHDYRSSSSHHYYAILLPSLKMANNINDNKKGKGKEAQAQAPAMQPSTPAPAASTLPRAAATNGKSLCLFPVVVLAHS